MLLRSRYVMFMASSVWIALILVVSVFRGGGAVPVRPSLEPAGPAPTLGSVQQAAELAELGDYEGAWRIYHAALVAAPEDVSLWYALGVTLSRLDRGAEAQEVFRYVVDRGTPGSEEVRVARQWLVNAGVLAPSVVFASTAETATAADSTAVVKGKVTWGQPEGNRPARARLLLHGVSGAGEGKRFTARAALGKTYRFERLPAGSYRLIGSVGSERLWDLTLEVEEAKEVVLDLTRDNGSNPTVALSQ